MTDHFAALDLPRRPWLDADAIKDAFHLRSTGVHPDRVHNADDATRRAADEHYAALNAAHQCLREPKERLQHLVQLERGRKPGDLRALPDDLMRLFAEVGAALRATDSVLKRREQAGSALMKAQTLQEALPLLEQMESLQARLQDRRAGLMADLQRLDAAWTGTNGAAQEAALDGAENLYHQFGFLDRWMAQLRERTIQLTL